MYFISQLSWEWKLFLRILFVCIQFKKKYKSFSVISYFPPYSYLFLCVILSGCQIGNCNFLKCYFFLRSMYSAVFQTDLGIFYAILRIFKILLRIFYTQKQLICKLKIFCSSKNIHISLWQKFSMQKCPYSALKMEKLCIVAVVHNSNQI